MKDQQNRKVINNDYWTVVLGGISLIFIAILSIDIETGGENIAIKVISLGGAIACISSLLYYDYKVRNYESLKNKAVMVLIPVIVGLTITAVYVFFFST